MYKLLLYCFFAISVGTLHQGCVSGKGVQGKRKSHKKKCNCPGGAFLPKQDAPSMDVAIFCDLKQSMAKELAA
jgi:hypothetical protein